jgi:hypothetical protein
MLTINQHEFLRDEDQSCVHCGTSRGMVAAGYGCIHRAAPSFPCGPRVSAVDDIDFIHARIKQLEAERTAENAR